MAYILSREELFEYLKPEQAEALKDHSLIIARLHNHCHNNKRITSVWAKDGEVFLGSGSNVNYGCPQEYRAEHGVPGRYSDSRQLVGKHRIVHKGCLHIGNGLHG